MVTHNNILEQYDTLKLYSNGAQIKAVDLHIHTPGSRQDYKIADKLYEHTTLDEIKSLAIKDGLVTEQQLNLIQNFDKDIIAAELIVHCAIKKELSLIAITDHNTFCWYERIISAYQSYKARTRSKLSLTILPGIEITAFGGNHVIGIFEPEGYLKAWNSLKHLLDIDDEVEGIDGPICTKSELDIVECIYNLGGVTYIPHIDTRSEKLADMLNNLSGKSKIKLLQNPKLLALGFSNYDRHLIVESELKNNKGKYFRKVPLAYLRDSDAHDPSEIGTKPMYLKLDQTNFLSFKFAIQDPLQRVLFNKPTNTKSKELLGLAIKNGWFKDSENAWQYFRFNSDLNCIIGGRGTGKSTIVNIVMNIVTQRTRSVSERDFISQFSNILLYLMIDTQVYCISLEPRIITDSYTGDRIDLKNRLSRTSLSIENWIKIYEIKNDKVVKVPLLQTTCLLASIGLEYFSQNEISEISNSHEMLLNLFDKIVSIYTDKTFAKLIENRNAIVTQIKDLAYNITNSNAMEKVYLLHQGYKELFDVIHSRRLETAKSLNNIFKNNISITIDQLPIKESYYNLLDEVCDDLFQNQYEIERAELIANGICSKIEPLKLINQIINKQYSTIIEVCNVPKWEPKSYAEINATKIDDVEILKKITNEIMSHVSRLLTLLEIDNVKILFNCSQHVGLNAFKAMDSLSFGQKAVVILTLITNLGENTGMPPLIIDQPEDHLDNHYIFSNLVTDLRKIKGRRQVILVTHNPNIVVSGDAEQVICLASDGIRGWVEIAGSIDRPKIQNFIVETLEGGKQALGIRIKKYANFDSYTD